MFTIDSSNPFPSTMPRAKSRLATLTASELEELRELQAAAAHAAFEQVRHAAATQLQYAVRARAARQLAELAWLAARWHAAVLIQVTLRGRGCRMLYAATVEAATHQIFACAVRVQCAWRRCAAGRARRARLEAQRAIEAQHDEMESFASARLALIVGASPRTAAAPRTRPVYYECGGESDGGGLELW